MNRLFEGLVRKAGEAAPQSFVVRKLTAADMTEILQVQERVIAHLDNKDILQPLSRVEYQYILEGKGLMLGAFVGNEMIAFRALLVPPIDEEHLGRDIGLAESELPKVIYQEISNVLPAYRGNRLQQTLADVIMKELQAEGSQEGVPAFRYVCCTVAPYNIPSLKDKFAQGMQIAALKEKYGGLLRYVFVRDLAQGGGAEVGVTEPPDSMAAAAVTETETETAAETILIPMRDTAAQQQKLAAGWRGFRMEQKNNEIWVHYRRS